MRKFSVGLDLGSQQIALAVFDHERQCSVPLEISGDKTMPTCISFEGDNTIVGKRAESRSARKCEGVLCAYRQMLYGMRQEWRMHREMCRQRWHFGVSMDEADGSQDKASESEHSDSCYVVQGEVVKIEEVIRKIIEVVCTTLIDAIRSGGALEVNDGQIPSFINFACSVPECLSEEQRGVISAGIKEALEEGLGPNIPLLLVNETLAIAMQYSSIPPIIPKTFMCIDLGASKLTVSIFELKKKDVDSFCLQEVMSRTNVFVSGSEIEYKLMQWCEKHKPFAESVLGSSSSRFKLRRDVRGAMKTLTVAEEAMIETDNLAGGNDLQVMLTLEDFEHECKDIFDSVLLLLEFVAKESNVGYPQEVILTGGAMRIPCLQRRIQQLLSPHGSSIRKTVDMDRGISLGAAMIAAIKHDPSVVKMPLDPTSPFEENSSRQILRVTKDGRLSHVAPRVEKVGRDVEEFNAKIEDIQSKYDAAMRRLQVSSDSEEKMKDQIFEQQKLIETLRSKVKELEGQVSDKSAGVPSPVAQPTSPGSEFAIARANALESESSRLREQVDVLRSRLSAAEGQCRILSQKQHSAELAVKEAQATKEEAMKKVSDMEETMRRMREEVEEAKKEKMRIEDQLYDSLGAHTEVDKQVKVLTSRLKEAENNLSKSQKSLSSESQRHAVVEEKLQSDLEVAQKRIKELESDIREMNRSPSPGGAAGGRGGARAGSQGQLVGQAAAQAQVAQRRVRIRFWRFAVEFML